MVKKKEFTKVKKKSWVDVLAPRAFQSQSIGESYVSAASNLLHRQVKANLMTLTRDIKKQNINAQFEVSEIKENKAFTRTIGFTLLPSAIRRLVRRRKNKISNSFVIKSKDNVSFRIKTLVITQFRVSRAIATALRKVALDIFTEHASKTDFENFFGDVFSTKLQREIKDNLKKIVPIKIVEVTYVKEIKPKKQ
tara:strand:- start:577 stop:1158 length:582 start_codon:yes stop_codon:yes gene_type:complete